MIAGSGAPDGQARTRAAFVSDFLHLPIAFVEASPLLSDPRHTWLRLISSEGLGDGEVERDAPTGKGETPETTVTVRVAPLARRAAPAVSVSAGVPRVRADSVLVPLTWRPVSFESLLPQLVGDLTLTDLGEEASRLALAGRYSVPLGAVGWEMNRLAMHRVVETTVRRFLADVGRLVAGA